MNNLSTEEVVEYIKQEGLDETLLLKAIVWGLSHRIWRRNSKKQPLKPKPSPISIPLKLCRAKQRNKKKHTPPKSPITLPERAALNQKEYMKLLSIPIIHKQPKPPPKKKRCCKCLIEPCPPRLVQMAVPNKRYVLSNWKTYQDLLPAEVILRFEQVLRTGNNSLEPRDARYYFKQLDKSKQKERRRKKLIRRERLKEKNRGPKLWLKKQINQTSEAVWSFLNAQASYTLNYREMMLSNEILNFLYQHKFVKGPKITCKSVYKRCIIKTSDKVAMWMEALLHLIDAKPLSSMEEIGGWGEEVSCEEELDTDDAEVEDYQNVANDLFEDEEFEIEEEDYISYKILGYNATGDLEQTVSSSSNTYDTSDNDDTNTFDPDNIPSMDSIGSSTSDNIE